VKRLHISVKLRDVTFHKTVIRRIYSRGRGSQKLLSPAASTRTVVTDTSTCRSLSEEEKAKLEVDPVHAMKAYGRSRGITPPVLNLVTRWRRVVSFTPRPLWALERRALELVETFWRRGESDPAGIRTPDGQSRSQSLYWLCYHGCCLHMEQNRLS